MGTAAILGAKPRWEGLSRPPSYWHATETGFYYLQSRYYDPVVKRFLNADAFASTGQGYLGYNMFAYCENNPVIAHDPTGLMMKTAYDPNRGPDTHHEPGDGFLLTIVKLAKEAAKDNTGAIVVGRACSAIGGIGATGSLGFGFDFQGNYGTVNSYGLAEGIPSAGIVRFLTFSGAPDLTSLSGPSLQYGGSAGEILIFGLEGTNSLNNDGENYSGLTASVGAGVGPIPVEVHGSCTDSIVIVQGNVWDDLIFLLGGSSL